MWVSAPYTTLGRSVGSPAARRLSRHENLWASNPSMIASDEPIVATPTASSTSGAFHRSASIRTQICSTRLAIGYSS